MSTAVNPKRPARGPGRGARAWRTVLQCLVGCSLLGLACAGQPRRFALAPPLWEDADRNPVSEKPDEYVSGLIADGVDKTLFRPLARLPYFPLPERAWNVNALDEVPNSSWFQNRIGWHEIPPERAAQAACGTDRPLDTSIPWTIISAKPNGANPGFFIKAGEHRYLLKFDRVVQPPRATSADVIASKIYWTAGYHAPCNQIVYFHRDQLSIAPDAESEDKYGNDRPITEQDIDTILKTAWRLKDGSLRASASRFLPGEPLGPFRYDRTRGDDPNDHVPHEHRRELRANRVLAAWLNHRDSREQNTLDVWVTEHGRSYVRHYMIDFGDCFGGRWEFDALSRRLGHSYFVDFEHLFVDFFTLGIKDRPWRHAELNDQAETFGYFSTKNFVASEWKGDYPNAAFIEMRYDDALWMARILSRFSDAHVRAIVKTADLKSERAERYLADTLIGRRDSILKEYFSQYAALDRFRIVRRDRASSVQSLCFEDTAILHGIADYRQSVYKIRFYAGRLLDQELGWLQFAPDPDHPHRSCIQLPLGAKRPADLAGADAAADDPLRYGVMKIFIHQRPSVRPTAAVHLHFYDLGPERGYYLVGIERPEEPLTPDLY